MIELLFTGLILAVAAVTSLALSARQSAARRFILVGLCAATFVVTGVLAEEFLGHPKPIALEWRDGEATVIANSFDEGEAIYLWLLWADENVPRAYVVPWDEHVAAEIAAAVEGVEQEGGEVIASVGDDRPIPPGELQDDLASASSEASLEDRSLIIYRTPHPKPPDKPAPRSARTYTFGPGRS